MKGFWLALFLLYFFGASLQGQDDKFKALFMYNFTKYLEWPTEKQRGNFIIGIYGNSNVMGELAIIAQKRKIGDQTMELRKIYTVPEARNCHILFIPNNRSAQLNEILKEISRAGVVVITESPGMAEKGSGLNYIKTNGNLNFEISKKNLEQQEVKVNPALLTLGVLVD